MEHDGAMNTYRNLSGIEISVPNFGDDVAFDTYQKLVDYLQNEHGYTQKNIRLAPYDWRLRVHACGLQINAMCAQLHYLQ